MKERQDPFTQMMQGASARTPEEPATAEQKESETFTFEQDGMSITAHIPADMTLREALQKALDALPSDAQEVDTQTPEPMSSPEPASQTSTGAPQRESASNPTQPETAKEPEKKMESLPPSAGLYKFDAIGQKFIKTTNEQEARYRVDVSGDVVTVIPTRERLSYRHEKRAYMGLFKVNGDFGDISVTRQPQINRWVDGGFLPEDVVKGEMTLSNT